MGPIPITILTGFLGSGKTTLLINLIPQLPKAYKLALLKNEFGDVAIDSQLASSSSISGVQELLNGCICCNLVGQLGDALETLRSDIEPDRIVIETSGSAFPATLALEVNRISAESGGERFALDGVISVVDVENWEGYEDTSVTAKMQAQYTDLVVFNKWEHVSERRFDECLDRLGDLGLETPWVKSNKGVVGTDVLLGIDGALARKLGKGSTNGENGHGNGHEHEHDSAHSSEVEVLSLTLTSPSDTSDGGVDLAKLDKLLKQAPKEEIYRIKAVLVTTGIPISSDGKKATRGSEQSEDRPGDERNGDEAHSKSNGSAATGGRYILNWAFGRWTFTALPHSPEDGNDKKGEILRMTIITGRYESTKWKKRLDSGEYVAAEGLAGEGLEVRKVA